MVDIASATAATVQTSSTVATAAITPVPTLIISAPAQIQSVSRQIEVTGTISQPPDLTGVTLDTALGSITLALPQLAEGQQQQLLQTLLAAFQNDKSLSVTIQPGTPPSQAVLFVNGLSALPQVSQTNQALSSQQISSVFTVATPAPGATYPAVVLPADLAWPLPTSSLLPGLQVAPLGAVSSSISAGAIQIENAPQGTITPTAIPATTQTLLSSPNLNAATPSLVMVAPTTGDASADVLSRISQLSARPAPSLAPASLSAQFSPTLQASAASEDLRSSGSPLATTSSLSNSSLSTPSRTDTVSSAASPSYALTSTNTSPSGASVATSASFPQPGAEIVIKIASQPLSTTPSAASLPANTYVATVIGNGSNGEPILKINDSTVYIKQSANLPVGTSVLVTVDTAKPATLFPMPSADAKNLTTFQQLLSALTQIDPQFAQQVLANAIPQPNPTMPATLLFLLSAFKQGSLRGWIGDDAVSALNQSGKIDLVNRLSQALKDVGQPVNDNVVGEWRSYPVPVLADNQFQMLSFYIHQYENNRNRENAGEVATNGKVGNVRFLIDMQMSKLGVMQLDGLVRQKQLDMIIRSEQALPEELHQELREAYIQTLSGIDYAGNLSFQTGRQNWLIMQKSAPRAVVT